MGLAIGWIKGTNSSPNRLVDRNPFVVEHAPRLTDGLGSGDPLISLACSLPGNAIAAGTETETHQASILIWDARAGSAPRIQYTEVHNDDVTEVSKFDTQVHYMVH